jgi:hypothetical protein
MSFLVELATSPRALAAFMTDRETYLDGTGLSDEAKRAVMSGDRNTIAALAGGGRAMFTSSRPTYMAARPMYKKKAAKKKAAKKKAAKKKAAKKKAAKKK